ncbi:UNVERIFIED_CONTAM: Chalcone synthase J [Sesamum latifolium]|uniref:chalcone synthase n=1 Tax=Sesamum latifolium TaxID=2727402 RepID=A0AAW2WDZ6_9LAMI
MALWAKCCLGMERLQLLLGQTRSKGLRRLYLGEGVCDGDSATVGQLGEVGLVIQLGKAIPRLISNNFEKSLIEAFEPWGISDWNSIFWAVHPSGPKIVNLIEKKLGLEPKKLRFTRHVVSMETCRAQAFCLYWMR